MMHLFMVVNDALVLGLDWVFGWILWLPRDLGLLAVAFLTSLSLALGRKWCADQNWLRRSVEDLDTLGGLVKAAKKQKDREAVARYKLTMNKIRLLSMKQEGRAVLGALLPVALVATWAFGRMAYIAPRTGETVETRVYLPSSAIGQYVHLVPAPGLTTTNGWVQTVVQDTLPKPADLWEQANAWIKVKLGMVPPLEGVARWRLTAAAPIETTLRFRYAGRTYEQPFSVGKRAYATPQTIPENAPVQATELALKPLKLLGFVGGLDFILLPPWLVGYLLLAIALMNVTKRLVKAY